MGDISGQDCDGCFKIQKLEGTNKSPTRAACVADVQAIKRIVEEK
jgi:hypothetical protein